MIRTINTTVGSITEFIPDVYAPKLILHVDFLVGENRYELRRYGNMFKLGPIHFHFAIYDDGRRLDLTLPDNSGTKVVGGHHNDTH